MEVKTNNYKCIHTLSIKIENLIFHQMKRGDTNDIGKL